MPGPAWFCEAAGSGSFSPASLPVSEEAGGSDRATGPSQRIHGQERMEAQERRCDPPAGTHQGCAGKKSAQ